MVIYKYKFTGIFFVWGGGRVFASKMLGRLLHVQMFIFLKVLFSVVYGIL